MMPIDKASEHVPADNERVYTAFTAPEALLAWLPQEGMSGRFERFDPRPGGTYRLALTCADAEGLRARPRGTPTSRGAFRRARSR